jgi:hypothetical protein
MAKTTTAHTTFDDWLVKRNSRSRRRKIYDWFRHRLPHILRHELRYKLLQPKYFYQRGRRGWADCDAWSICDYMPDVMIGMISRMTDGGIIGAPLFEEDNFEANQKKWEEILLAIADGFHAAKEINDYNYSKHNDEVWQRFYRGMNLYKKYFFSLWD